MTFTKAYRSKKKFDRLWLHFACDCAEMVEHLITDERSKKAIVVARKNAEGEATIEEVKLAFNDASYASRNRLKAYIMDETLPHHTKMSIDSAAYLDSANEDIDGYEVIIRNLLIEYCRTGKRVNWLEFFGGKNPFKGEIK